LRVHLRNRLPVPTTIHWHGLDLPFAMDGVPFVTQDAVLPGEDFTYEFVATNPGTRMFHSHVDSNLQMELGLYGVLIVEPRQPGPVQYDHDYTYILDEKALDITEAVALGRAQVQNQAEGNGRGGAFAYDLFLINGRAADAIPPLQVSPGQKIRLRLVNLGNLPHAMHLHGHSFTIIATDGNPVPPGARLVKDTVLLGPGERYDIEIAGHNPGVWMFHCHMPNHSENGMMTALVYDGFEVPGIGSHPHSSAPPVATPASAAGHADAPAAPAGQPAAGTDQPPTQASLLGGPNQSVTVLVVDNRFEPSTLRVAPGTTVVWKNVGNNVHTASSFDGLFETGTIRPGEEASFTFLGPGDFRYYCRQHLFNGTLGRVIVE
ncbi:MAG: multicopper oxidase domain-containing protein, partial [Propionibacteriaceae bacterium]|nr:multicopper oxidase domain-containing protein [Propionibacteriaceae bacterium]